MKKTYQKLSLVPLGIKVESSILQNSIEVDAQEVNVVRYKNGFADESGNAFSTGGFTEEGGYTINF